MPADERDQEDKPLGPQPAGIRAAPPSPPPAPPGTPPAPPPSGGSDSGAAGWFVDAMEAGLNNLAVIRTTFETLDLFADDEQLSAEMIGIIHDARAELVRRLECARDVATQAASLHERMPAHPSLQDLRAARQTLGVLLEQVRDDRNYRDRAAFEEQVFGPCTRALQEAYARADARIWRRRERGRGPNPA